MEKKYTKGECKVSDLGTIHASGNRNYVHGDKDVAITTDYNKESYRYDEAKANARLIAAAPDMLEVLETIENDNNQVPEWLWTKIKVVIKKATE